MTTQLMQEELAKLESETQKKLLTPEEVSVQLGISEFIRFGEIASKVLGNKVYVRTVDVIDFIYGTGKENVEKLIPTVDEPKNLMYNHSPSIINREDDDMDKKRNGEGSIYFGNDGSWHSALSLGYGEDGKRLRKVFGGKTKEDVERKMYEYLEDNGLKKNEPQGIVMMTVGKGTVNDLQDEYLRTTKGKARKRSFENIISISKHVAEGLGSVSLTELTRNRCVMFLNSLTDKTYKRGKRDELYSQSTIRKIYIQLMAVLRYAIDEGYIKPEVIKGLKTPIAKKYVEEKEKAFSDEEIKAIISAVKDNPLINATVMILNYTGMRPGEAFALRFSDVDYESKTIHVRRALSHDVDSNIEDKTYSKRVPIIKEIKNSKNGRHQWAYRTLKVSDKVLGAISKWEEHRKSQVRLTEKIKLNGYEDQIFTGADGKLAKAEHYQDMYERQLRNQGLDSRILNLYRFRHNYCTRQLRMNVDIKTVAQNLGDNTVDMVLRVYNSINNKDRLAASEKFSDAMDDILGE
ncbi:MAG TPA: hypothetical protein DCP90_08460 [Clostridiales bacterium]|nr:MAG: hypothetical protein A2Y22_08300 [Clostridiales bacterium GWD2_32_59]HAN10625.1 hypothetical protein [Clostridiales bacterium]